MEITTEELEMPEQAYSYTDMDSFLQSVQSKAYRMAKLSTLNTEDALDMVQDAMFKLIKNYSDKPVAELRPLFYTILSSTLKDWHRRRVFRNQFHYFFSDKEYDTNPIESLADDFAQSSEQWLSNQQDVSKLLLALSELSERQRQTFLLRAWQGFSVKETAKIMSCSEGSVKTHYFRANKLLNEMLNKHTGDSHDES